jgi:hypothetical protein
MVVMTGTAVRAYGPVMRRLALGVAAAVLVASGLAAILVWQLGDSGGPLRPRHVILIDWDGFDPDYVGRVAMPHLDALVERGSLSMAESTFPTLSNSARASMVSGAYPERHGNVGYVLDPASGVVRGQDRVLTAQTITEALGAAGRTVACVQWYMVQDRGAFAGDARQLYVEPGGPFADRVTVAIDILNRRAVTAFGHAAGTAFGHAAGTAFGHAAGTAFGHAAGTAFGHAGAGPRPGETVTVPEVPALLAVYGDDLDALAHREGTAAFGMGPLLREMDRELGRLVQATKDLGIYDVTTFILTSDHGMTDWNLPLLPEAVAAVSATGLVTEVVGPDASPAVDSEVVIVPNAVTAAAISLRGRAATAEGRDNVRRAMESLGPAKVRRVLAEPDLRSLRAGSGLADFLVEAQPPYGFAASVPLPGFTRAAHGSTGELMVPLVVSGPGFRRGAVLREPKLVDVAPTIASLLGVPIPAQAQGRPLNRTGD